MRKVVIYGAGFQGQIIAELLQSQAEFSVMGFLDDDEKKQGKKLYDAKVLGGFDWLLSKKKKNICTIVSIGNNVLRHQISEKLRDQSIAVINCIHSSVVRMPSVSIGSGNCICPGVVLMSGTKIENDVIINSGSIIEHDSYLKNGSQIASGVRTAGCVRVGEGSFVGIGSTIGPNVEIGDNSIIGAGSVVLKNIPSNVLAFGSPAKIIKKVSERVNWRRILSGS